MEPALGADAIREAFERRARGDSFQSIADFLTASGVKPGGSTNPGWSRSGVSAGEIASRTGGALTPSAVGRMLALRGHLSTGSHYERRWRLTPHVPILRGCWHRLCDDDGDRLRGPDFGDGDDLRHRVAHGFRDHLADGVSHRVRPHDRLSR